MSKPTPCALCGQIHPEQPNGDQIIKCNAHKKKDNAEIENAGPFGPYPKRRAFQLYEDELTNLADSLEWMLKDMMFRANETELPDCQSDEMRTALNQYRDLCMLIGKDPTLL